MLLHEIKIFKSKKCLIFTKSHMNFIWLYSIYTSLSLSLKFYKNV